MKAIMTGAALLMIMTILFLQETSVWAICCLALSMGWIIYRAWGKEEA